VRSRLAERLVNFGLYQAGWFALVLGAAHAQTWTGTSLGIAVVVIHLLLVTDPSKELVLLLSAGLFGTVVDSFMGWAGVIEWRAGYTVAWICPLWMSILWVQFAMLLRHTVSWLHGRYLLATLLGALGAPFAYYSGVRFGAATFPLGTAASLLILAAVWTAVSPGLFLLATRLGFSCYRSRILRSFRPRWN